MLPENTRWHRLAESGVYPLEVVEPLKERAKAEGLWNLFLPGLRPDEPGTRLTNLEYAPLAEIMGRIPWAAEVFNCNAPDTGNMEILHLFATPEQRARWLDPLLAGDIRSGRLDHRARRRLLRSDQPRDHDHARRRRVRDQRPEVVQHRRAPPQCAGSCSCWASPIPTPRPPRHGRHSFVIVPMDAPGFSIVRNIPIMNHHAPDGHCEVLFRDVRVPVSNLLGGENEGFAVAQARLGPGRIHHCMRTIGQCELALEMMAARALERKAFGRHLADYANIQDRHRRCRGSRSTRRGSSACRRPG